jgi:hypothetical protein
MAPALPKIGRLRCATVLLASCLGVSACGTRVPEIQEIGDDVAGQQMVQAIVTNVTCEVQDAIAAVYKNRKRLFLDSWGVQITLNLTVDEKTDLAPNVSLLPTTIFTLGLGGGLSSEATRIDKLNSFWTVKQLRNMGACDPRSRAGRSKLLASDLKLKQWLFDNLTASDTGEIDFARDATSGPFGQNVISHEVKFEVVSTGSLTPSWKLTRVLVNSTGTFVSISRDRTHDLIITLGPTNDAGTGPSQTAANAALASDIGVSVANGIKQALQPQ